MQKMTRKINKKIALTIYFLNYYFNYYSVNINFYEEGIDKKNIIIAKNTFINSSKQ